MVTWNGWSRASASGTAIRGVLVAGVLAAAGLAGPANLDWGVWVVLYGGYGYVISAAIFHARTGR